MTIALTAFTMSETIIYVMKDAMIALLQQSGCETLHIVLITATKKKAQIEVFKAISFEFIGIVEIPVLFFQ